MGGHADLRGQQDTEDDDRRGEPALGEGRDAEDAERAGSSGEGEVRGGRVPARSEESGRTEENVDEQSEQSFPASDPPSYS